MFSNGNKTYIPLTQHNINRGEQKTTSMLSRRYCPRGTKTSCNQLQLGSLLMTKKQHSGLSLVGQADNIIAKNTSLLSHPFSSLSMALFINNLLAIGTGQMHSVSYRRETSVWLIQLLACQSRFIESSIDIDMKLSVENREIESDSD